MRYLQSLVVSLVAFGGVAMLAPAQAHAQAAGAEAAPKLWVGGHLGLSPVGTLKADVSGTSASADTALGFEIGGRVEYQVMPFLSIGIAPAILFNIKGKDDTESATALDLPLRITAGGDVAPRIRLYGFAAPGYTFLFPPSDASVNSMNLNSSGFMIGFGGGASFQVAPKFRLSGELGYHFRFPSTTVQNVDVSFQDNYLTFAVSAAAGF